MSWTAPEHPPAHEDYPPISDYAIIGDGRCAALVCRDGSIDWLCLPEISSPSLFAAILDRRVGGYFGLTPAQPFSTRRWYRRDTNILETEYRGDGWTVQVTDLIPVSTEGASSLTPASEVLRILRCRGGAVDMRATVAPRPDFARAPYRLDAAGAIGWRIAYHRCAVYVRSDVPLAASQNGADLHSAWRMQPGDTAVFSLTFARDEPVTLTPLTAVARRVTATERFWRDWVGRCTYQGPHRDIVVRSLLTVRLMTFVQSGAVYAAPTASLPESIGGERNWDYRYCWLRDAALTFHAYALAGYGDEAAFFLKWLLHASRHDRRSLPFMYDAHGRRVPAETDLEHLEGYRGSRPVRVGNSARDQRQLDGYGAVICTAHGYALGGGTLSPMEKRMIVAFGHEICRQWRREENGLWEIRGKRRHYTYGKIMCWAGLDHLLRLHDAGVVQVPVDVFRTHRDAIRAANEIHGFHREKGAYVASWDSDRADASVLLAPRYGYCHPRSARMIGTEAFVTGSLGQGPWLRRYDTVLDPHRGGEGAFGICSFWRVDYLALAGQLDRAEHLFDALCGSANDVGLYSEEVDVDTGTFLGNFPQAFTHVGLITAAIALQSAKRRRRTGCTVAPA